MSEFSSYDNFMNNDTITLEPRLQNYVEKKIYYKKHNINPSVPLEKTYQISKADRAMLKSFYKNNNNLYECSNKDNNWLDLIDTTNQKFDTSEDEFKKDPRYERLRKKLNRDKIALKQRHNYENYTVISPVDTNKSYFNNEIRLNSFVDDEYEQELFLDEKDKSYEIKNNLNHYPNVISDKYHVTPELKYKQINHIGQSGCKDSYMKTNNDFSQSKNRINRTFNDLDSYVDHVNTIYNKDKSYDKETRINKGGCKFASSNYQPIPMLGAKSKLRGNDVDYEMKCNYPTTNKKSLGFENPAEHYFDYITPEIQSPEHTVLPFPRGGIDTRNNNHSKLQQKREIY